MQREANATEMVAGGRKHMERKANRLGWLCRGVLLACLALMMVLVAKPACAYADSAHTQAADTMLADLNATITVNGTQIDLSKAYQYDTSRTDGCFFMADVSGDGAVSVDSINTTANSSGWAWELTEVHNGRSGDGMYCYLAFIKKNSKLPENAVTLTDGYVNRIGIQLGGSSTQSVYFDTNSPVTCSNITWPDGYTPPTTEVSELKDVNVKFWNMTNSTTFVPDGFTPTKSCDVTVSGYAVPCVGNGRTISQFADYVNTLLPDGWTATGTPVDNGNGTTTFECKVSSLSDSSSSVTWKFTYTPQLPATNKSDTLTNAELAQRANFALYQGSTKILYFKDNDWKWYGTSIVDKGTDVAVKTSGSTDLWYAGSVWVSSLGYVTPSGWQNSNGEPCSYDDSDAAKYVWNLTAKDSGVNYGYDLTADKQIVYRMYNPITSEHLFTTDKTEYEDLVKHDWRQEGMSWASPRWSAKGVYRLYNPGLGALAKMSHHYTTDKAEADDLVANHGWVYDNDEQPIFYSAEDNTGAFDGAEPVYRLYNGGLSAHHYTLDSDENDRLIAKYGWNGEGIGFYAYSASNEE
jgi:hypothetical protein